MDEIPTSRYEVVYFVGANGEVEQKTFSLFCKTLINHNDQVGKSFWYEEEHFRMEKNG